jgi:hypothetical protein
LLYLAGQIRQNSRLLKVSTAAAVADADNTMTSLMVQEIAARPPRRRNAAE